MLKSLLRLQIYLLINVIKMLKMMKILIKTIGDFNKAVQKILPKIQDDTGSAPKK